MNETNPACRTRLPHAIALAVLLAASAPAISQTIKHPDQSLYSIYPAGARQGQTVTVEMGGLGGLGGATGLIIDGPPGITVRDVKSEGASLVRATLTVAADAAPGKRLVRVLGGSCGLTNARPFFVGRLPDVLEKEPNDTPEKAQEVELPAVVNGRLGQDLDVDCFAFRARAGQHIVAAILAHGMDSLMQGKLQVGYLDTSLELLDDQGRVLASADDTLGLDPVLDHVIKADGRYVVRVLGLDFKGSPTAVYRLTLGEVPYPMAVFPAGGRRGETTTIRFTGPNVPADASRKVTAPAATDMPWGGVVFDDPLTDGRELPFVWGDHSERTAEESKDRDHAATLEWPVTVNGRFDKAGAAWFRVRLKKGQNVLFDVTAQRHLRSPADTLLEIYDATGRKLTENDDGALYGAINQCAHDFASSDSWLPFKVPADGDYFVRLSDQNGTSGPTAIYRLTVSELKPDFVLYQWPDAVPVWGPGGTATFVLHLMHWGGMNADIRLSVEGLPPGWSGEAGMFAGPNYSTMQLFGGQVLVTITAPPDAAPGTVAPFRVVGRSEQGGQKIERAALPMTLYGGGADERRHLRFTPQARAVVAPSLGCRLETTVKELTAKSGETVQIPVKIYRQKGVTGDMALTIDGPTVAAASNWGVPLTIKGDADEIKVPLTVNANPGVYGLVVSRSWASDLRAARPGPCTQLILLRVLPGGEVKGKTKGGGEAK